MPIQRFSGAKLRMARVAAGVRPETVAIAIGRSSYTISAYERDTVAPPANVIANIATALDCSPSDFFEVMEATA